MLNILLITAGVGLFVLACWFASRQAERTYLTMRDLSNFSGDVQAWLRGETN